MSIKNKNIKRFLKEIVSFLFVTILSFFVLNLLTFLFYHPVHEIKRAGGATPGLMVPFQYALYGTEGYGFHLIDVNGYPNPNLPKENDYYIVIGSSHTEGFHSRNKERYCDLLNKQFGKNTLKFYNIAHSGFFFDGIAKHFKGLTGEFNNIKGVIIEIGKTDYSVEQLQTALMQTDYVYERDSIEFLLNSLTRKEKIKIFIKNYFPLFRLLTSQLHTYKESKRTNKTNTSSFTIDNNFSESLDKVLLQMRNEFDGKIIIVYHPMTTLNSDGSLNIATNESDCIFAQLCSKNQITFINMNEEFIKEYYDNKHAVYGFWNTTLMTGHINKYGHQLIAKKIFECIKEEME